MFSILKSSLRPAKAYVNQFLALLNAMYSHSVYLYVLKGGVGWGLMWRRYNIKNMSFVTL
jgi:hypothetical protein